MADADADADADFKEARFVEEAAYGGLDAGVRWWEQVATEGGMSPFEAHVFAHECVATAAATTAAATTTTTKLPTGVVSLWPEHFVPCQCAVVAQTAIKRCTHGLAVHQALGAMRVRMRCECFAVVHRLTAVCTRDVMSVPLYRTETMRWITEDADVGGGIVARGQPSPHAARWRRVIAPLRLVVEAAETGDGDGDGDGDSALQQQQQQQYTTAAHHPSSMWFLFGDAWRRGVITVTAEYIARLAAACMQSLCTMRVTPSTEHDGVAELGTAAVAAACATVADADADAVFGALARVLWLHGARPSQRIDALAAETRAHIRAYVQRALPRSR